MTLAGASLLGRAGELSTISALIEDARKGESRAIVIVGPAGAGKTSLLTEAVARAIRDADPPMRQLRARGIESEAEVAFAGLLELIHPLAGLIHQLPAPQAKALEGALALSTADVTDRFSVCAATLAILEVAAADAPLLVVVDDLHWIDPASTQAILFAARRLWKEGIAILLSTRPETSVSGLLDGLDHLDVAPLPADAAASLARSSAGRTLADTEVEALIAGTGGNPLALVEAARQLTASSPVIDHLEPIPVAERIRVGVERRLEPMDELERRAVLIAAATGTRADAGLLGPALVAAGISLGALDAAERQGLVRISPDHVEFDHPLTRSAVYALASSAERRVAHGALASGASDGSAERAWHLAAAAFGVDERAADALEHVGHEALTRGAPSTALRAFERAAALSEDTDGGGRRLLLAGGAARLAGNIDHAREILVHALELSSDPLRRADVLGLLFQIETWRAPVATARSIAVEADEVAKLDRARSARMLAEAASALSRSGHIAQSVEFAERAHVEMQRLGIQDDAVDLSLLLAMVADARAPGAVTNLIALGERVVTQAPTAQSLVILQQVGWIETWIEQYDAASRLLDHAVDVGRRQAPGSLPMALATRAELAYRQGRLVFALADAEEASLMAADFAQDHAQGLALTCQARIEACLGHADECRRTAGQAKEIGRRLGGEGSPIAAWGSPALGLLALSEDDPEGAIPHLETLVHAFERGRLREPGVVLAAGDLVEAYHLAGRAADARNLLRTFGGLALATERIGAQAIAARCEGLLADDGDYEACFVSALALHDAVDMPFERARTHRALGMRRWSSRDSAGAVRAYREALDLFERLGAERWAAGVSAALKMTGTDAPKASSRRVAALTPQELRVAHAAATGLELRDVAKQLLLSRASVEAHLERAYEKLGVRSSGEISALLGYESSAPSLVIRSEGPLRVTLGDRVLGDHDLGSPRARRLLTALLSFAAPVERTQLAAWIWPDLGGDDRREALEAAIVGLRNVLGEHRVEVGDTTVWARLAPEDDWDLAHAVRVAEDPEAVEPAELRQALGRADLPLPSAWRETPWGVHFAGRRREAERRLQGRLAFIDLASGAVEQAEATFAGLLDEEPTGEEWHRGLMKCLAARGDIPRALRQIHICRSALRQAHGTDPGEETNALYLELLAR